MRWILPLLVCAQVVSAQPAAAQSVFPLPIPTRPTSFPLTQRIELDEASIATVVAWGRNNEGQTSVPAGLAEVVQVSAGFNHSVALKSDGTVVAWGDSSRGKTTVPTGLQDVVQVSAGAGGLYTLALKSDGTVAAWGDNITFFSGQSIVPADLQDVVQVSAGTAHVVVLKIDGTVEEWGPPGSVSGVPAGLRDVVQVGAGQSHSVALKSDGTLVAWGNNDSGQATVPADLANVVQFSVGSLHTVALRSDGTVVAWGWNNGGQTSVPAGLAEVVQVSAGQFHSVALKSDGTVVAWGDSSQGRTSVPAGLVDVVQVSAGSGHTLAVKVSQGLAGAATKRPFDPATAANWSAGGAEWSVDTTTTHDGVDSAKAQTTDGQSTYREYTVAGPAVVDFWWKVSSEQGFDTFSYSVNGINQQTISGEVDWSYRTLTLPAGTHTIRWTYSKDDSGGIGQDAGWVDDFAVYPATATLIVRDGTTVLNGAVTVDFGDADIGSSGFTKSLTFSNEGYVPQEVELSLPASSPFTFDGGSTNYSLLLGRGESVDVPISLSTAVRGTKTAQLTILAPDSTTPAPQITLTGVVLGPVIGVSAAGAPIASGQNVDLGLAPRTLQFTISNTGNVGDLLISGISVTGNFQITQQPQASIPPQGNTTFTVLAQGGSSGVQSGTVTITSNDTLSETFSFSIGSKSLFSIDQGIAADSVATSGTGGASGWDFASTQLPSGSTGQALKTGATPNSGGSVLEFTSQTAGVVSWTWKVSTQENFDWLLCEVDGQEAAGISTKNGVWQTQVVNVPSGATVRWVYRKDGSGNIGEDAGYLTDVTFAPMSGDQSFAEWSTTHGITDPNASLPRTAMSAMFAWLGGVNPTTGSDAGHYKPIIEGGRLKYRYPISKTADGTQQILYSSDMSAWTTRRFSQRVVSEDANRMVIEATAPSATKGFFKVVGGGDTSGIMVRVQGGTLENSELAVTTVSTFQIGKTEVTWGEWQRVWEWAVQHGYDFAFPDRGAATPAHPVRHVNWFDAVKWCNAKSEMEGLAPVYHVVGGVYRVGQSLPNVQETANGYRLPTEAEWEWAARGGVLSQGYAYSGGHDLNAVAWNYYNSVGAVANEGAAWGLFGVSRGTWPVAQKLPNELGLHDMSGNVVEWTAQFAYPKCVIRGGFFLDTEVGASVRYRSHLANMDQREPHIGFRVARNAD